MKLPASALACLVGSSCFQRPATAVQTKPKHHVEEQDREAGARDCQEEGDAFLLQNLLGIARANLPVHPGHDESVAAPVPASGRSAPEISSGAGAVGDGRGKGEDPSGPSNYSLPLKCAGRPITMSAEPGRSPTSRSFWNQHATWPLHDQSQARGLRHNEVEQGRSAPCSETLHWTGKNTESCSPFWSGAANQMLGPDIMRRIQAAAAEFARTDCTPQAVAPLKTSREVASPPDVAFLSGGAAGLRTYNMPVGGPQIPYPFPAPGLDLQWRMPSTPSTSTEQKFSRSHYNGCSSAWFYPGERYPPGGEVDDRDDQRGAEISVKDLHARWKKKQGGSDPEEEQRLRNLLAQAAHMSTARGSKKQGAPVHQHEHLQRTPVPARPRPHGRVPIVGAFAGRKGKGISKGTTTTWVQRDTRPGNGKGMKHQHQQDLSSWSLAALPSSTAAVQAETAHVPVHDTTRLQHGGWRDLHERGAQSIDALHVQPVEQSLSDLHECWGGPGWPSEDDCNKLLACPDHALGATATKQGQVNSVEPAEETDSARDYRHQLEAQGWNVYQRFLESYSHNDENDNSFRATDASTVGPADSVSGARPSFLSAQVAEGPDAPAKQKTEGTLDATSSNKATPKSPRRKGLKKKQRSAVTSKSAVKERSLSKAAAWLEAGSCAPSICAETEDGSSSSTVGVTNTKARPQSHNEKEATPRIDELHQSIGGVALRRAATFGGPRTASAWSLRQEDKNDNFFYENDEQWPAAVDREDLLLPGRIPTREELESGWTPPPGRHSYCATCKVWYWATAGVAQAHREAHDRNDYTWMYRVKGWGCEPKRLPFNPDTKEMFRPAEHQLCESANRKYVVGGTNAVCVEVRPPAGAIVREQGGRILVTCRHCRAVSTSIDDERGLTQLSQVCMRAIMGVQNHERACGRRSEAVATSFPLGRQRRGAILPTRSPDTCTRRKRNKTKKFTT